MSYVYIRSEPGLWTVGFYKPDGKWESESDHASRSGAAARVHYLNGGASPNPELLAACKRMAAILDPRVEPMSFERDATLAQARAAIARTEHTPQPQEDR